jgi:hypothetical protein
MYFLTDLSLTFVNVKSYRLATSNMFGLFKKKSPLDKLYKDYETALAKSKELSTSDRKASDAEMTKASHILEEIARLKSQN